MKAVMSKNLKATLADKTARNSLRENLTRTEEGAFTVPLAGQVLRFKIGAVELSLPTAKKPLKAAA